MICKRYAISRNGDFSTRAEDGNMYIDGYFAVYNSRYELWNGAYETIDTGAFDGETDGDVRALTNHDTTLVLGRTISGTLTLRKAERDEIKKRQVKKWRDEMTAKLKGAANGT